MKSAGGDLPGGDWVQFLFVFSGGPGNRYNIMVDVTVDDIPNRQCNEIIRLESSPCPSVCAFVV